jgi:DNA-nicking Smr family endonuclease
MFASRNAAGLPENVIDLHGLHVQEALSYLEILLIKLEQRYTTCMVITGTGHHSFHRHLSERQQVRRACAERSWLICLHCGIL